MSERVPRVARWILACAGLLVPGYRREAWRRQWIAELEHRYASGGEGRPVVRFAFGSLAHALYLRREEMTMRGWWGDLTQSVRALARTPGFTLLTVATLAVGIGTTVGVFSIVEAVMLRPLPMEGGERLVRIFSTNVSRGSDRFSVSYPDYVDFAARTDLFESSSLYVARAGDLSGAGNPERVRITAVSGEYFQTLRSAFLLGRAFSADDQRSSAEATVVLAESFWERRFASDSTVLGRAIKLDGVPHVVVGVLRDAQGWPAATQVWTPLQWGSSVPDYAGERSNHGWQVVARLRPDVGVRHASEQIGSLARRIYGAPGIIEQEVGTGAIVVAMSSSESGAERAAIFGVMGVAVLLVLLIACLNASGLLLTRAWGRARELSLRAALGASRIRLAAIVLTESLLLALGGGVVGLGLAHLALRQVVRSLPVTGPDLMRIELNGSVAGVALLISVAASVLAGLIPAVRASRSSVAESLKEGGAHASQGRAGSHLRRSLVVAEVALSLALLVSAGLSVRAFQRQVGTDPGFDPSNLLSFTVQLPAARYGEPALVEEFYDDAVTALQRGPGVLAATSTSRLPLGAGGYGLFRSFILEGAAPPPEGSDFGASWVEVDADYFRTMGIVPLEGRGFTRSDRSDAPPVAIVSRSLSRQMSPDGSIVGRQMRTLYDEILPRTVVGVIDDIQFRSLTSGRDEALVLVPRSQAARASMGFLVRTVGDPSSVMSEVRRVMAGLDSDIALDAMQSLRDAHGAELVGVRFLTVLFSTFGALALLLAVSGVYGLVSYSVAHRSQEIGIRMAMGASASAVRMSVLREGAMLAAIGLAIGVVIAYGFSRLLAAAVFGLMEIDPVTFLGVSLLLGMSVLAASWIPAVRATRIDPAKALQSD